MSKALGPIHHWLYKKIKLQEELVEFLVQEQTELLEKANDLYRQLPSGELVDVIEEGNIHQWLQGQINTVEKRLAYVYHELKKNVDKEILLDRISDFGKKHRMKKDNPKEVFDELQNILIDGMPCDRVNALVSHDENQITWELKDDLHAVYWEELSESSDEFHLLRSSFINAMLDGYEYNKKGNICTIVRNI